MTSKPVVFSVDDDPAVLGAISRDLRKRYGSQYRIMRADSGAAALEAIRQLKQRNDPVALFVVDQRMPQMTGVEFLGQAMQVFPDAKRALLTAYADTEAAIQAINSAAIHYYLLKPWDPPEEKLYPVLDDLLDDWQASYRPAFSGVRVIGHRWSPEAHDIKEFLARNHVPYQYLDVELDQEAQGLMDELSLDRAGLPYVVLADGEVLRGPTPAAVAERVGLRTHATQPFYDLIIVGAGPAGLAAAVYGASEGLHTILIERQAPGGQAGTSSRIENYLGFPSGLSGADLARRAVTQARRFGVEILAPQEVIGLRTDGPYHIVSLADGSEISGHAVVIAVGLSYRTLDVPNVERLTGRGIYYGASLTEVIACQGQPAFVVGAGNSAGQAALYLAEFASQVTMLVRGDSLEAKMSQYLVDRIYAHPKLEVLLETEVTAVHGGDHLEEIGFRQGRRDNSQEHLRPAAALFIFIGAIPYTDWLRGTLKMDKWGFVLAGPQVLDADGKLPRDWPLDRQPFLLESSLPGVFVVGDARSQSIKRVASAVGEGSIAVRFIHEHLAKVK